MAIYKLKELFSKKPEYGIGLKAKKEGKYAYVRQSDIGGSNFQYKVNRGPILKYNDILISRAGAYSGKSYIHKIRDENHVFAGFLVRYSFVNEVDNDYFYLWTKTKNYTDQVLLLARSGSTMPKLNPPVFSEMVINLPPLKQQKAIIEIIKPIKSLFLKYPKMIRIDNIEKTRIDIKNIIEIIKPFETLEYKINEIEDLMISILSGSIKHNSDKNVYDYVDNIRNGFPYSKKHEDQNGLHKIFKIKNISNEFNYKRTNKIKNNLLNEKDVITGLSGTIGTATVISEKGWASNQRTLSLETKYPFQIKNIIEKQRKFLMMISTGAAQKNITSKNILDLNFEPGLDYSWDDLLLKLKGTKNIIKTLKTKMLELMIK